MSQEIFPFSPLGRADSFTMVVVAWLPLVEWLSLYLLCFAGCKGVRVIFMSCQTSWELSIHEAALDSNRRLAAVLFDQQFLQAESTDKSCEALIRNKALRCYLVILEKGRAVLLQACLTQRFPFSKLAEFPSCIQVTVLCHLANINWNVSWKLPELQIKLLNGEGSIAGIPDVFYIAGYGHRAKDLAGCMAQGYFCRACCGSRW